MAILAARAREYRGRRRLAALCALPAPGDFGGQSPGVQRAAATGRPLCAPCAMRDITQKKYWERNMFGNSTEQPLFQERNHCKLITVSTHGAVCLPGGG
ncbi:hypothetical protein BW261_18525 [Klebsiella aerogenes]|nr:hypothetical protein BW261_18525 [Klebsiella aerogenes]